MNKDATNNNLNTEQRKRISLAFPELAPQMMQQDFVEALKEVASKSAVPPELLDKMALIKGTKGDKGEKGDDGKSITGPKGEQGKSGKDGRDGKDGVNGKNGKNGLDGLNGINGRDGKDGKDAPKVDLDKLMKPLSRKFEELSTTLSPKGKIDQRWGGHGGGLSKISTDGNFSGLGTPASPLSLKNLASAFKVTPVGAINNSNTVYTLTYAPIANTALLVLNGQILIENTDYTISGTTLTMSPAINPSNYPAGVSFVLQGLTLSSVPGATQFSAGFSTGFN